MKTKVGILGATGYTGVVLTRLLLNHPNVDLTYLSSEQYAEKYYYEVYPAFFDLIKDKCRPVNVEDISDRCDFVFLATPNGFSKDFLTKLLKQSPKIKAIDLSADLRLTESLESDKNKFKIIYGIPEINREEIKLAAIIANPGCYPTSAILGLTPAIKNSLIDLNSIIIDSKSGTSGAGKQLKQETLFCEVNENFAPYNLAGKHRHIPEIENELFKISGKKLSVTFSPHLLPINRGIISTIYADLINKDLKQSDIYKIYKNFYSKELFVKVLPEGIYANTKNVRYTNFCHISPFVDERTKKLIIVSAIDNMVKGASGQAIQNMNIILSLRESTGLDSLGQIP